MPQSITQAFVIQFDNTIRQLAQQKASRLESTVTDRGNITGESFTVNNLAALEDTPENNVRHGDTVWSNAEHQARTAIMKDFFQALPIDRNDLPKLLTNPVGSYTENLMSAWNRRKDQEIYQALIGDALLKEGGTVTVPADQMIAAGGAGITKAKLIEAKSMFRANEADEHNGEQLFMIYTSGMLNSILNDSTLTSADFMSIKMLQEGAVAGKWLGFNWIPYERIKKDVSGVYTTVAYCGSAVHKGIGYVEGDVGPRRDKKNLTQVSMEGSIGAVRAEEKKVVLINFV